MKTAIKGIVWSTTQYHTEHWPLLNAISFLL